MKKNLHSTPLSKRKMENEYQDEESILRNPIEAFTYHERILWMIDERNDVVEFMTKITRLSLDMSEILKNSTQLHEEQLSFASLELQEIIKGLNDLFSRIQKFGLSIEDQQMFEESSVILPREMSKYPITIIDLSTKIQKMLMEKFFEGKQAGSQTVDALYRETLQLEEIETRFRNIILRMTNEGNP
ncbi:PREDICTED: uncharacterized protein LOC105451171 [Wasmannia auropunctata]|uniref:uncharacterized protein LOC105451171 n=1 Tax=Wasmannia auropunctata TaxID=64793 RepID=UPI0005EFBDCA|nr:PREDICTED: uncharacterized protein LOC105451171 [Wasmannia auropunctata]